jgi:uncharacterized protein (TIGR03437 family)
MKKLLLLVCAGAGSLLAQAPTITAIYNSGLANAGIKDTRFCPGSTISIYGTGFPSGTVSATSTAPVPANIVTVNVGGIAAYVTFESSASAQINAQIPFNAPIGATQVTVTTSAGTSAAFNITTLPTAPTLAVTSSTLVGVFANLSGKFISPSNLANAGQVLVLYATGLGPTDPAVPAGPAPTSLASTTSFPVITVGGLAAQVSFAGLAPSQVGLYQVNFTVPAGAQGSAPVVLSIGGQSSNTATLPLFGISSLTGPSYLDTGTAAPEEIITIYANGLGATNQLSGVFPATTSEGVSVTFNGIGAPIFALAATGNQINLIVPAELPTTGTVQVQLTTPTGTSPNLPLVMDAAVPGFFLIHDPTNATATPAAAQFANTVWDVLPTATATAIGFAINCTASDANPLSACAQPAAPGDYLVLYVSGLGAATPKADPNGTPLATGAVAPADGSPLYETIATPIVKIGSVPAKVLFSGIAPGTAGEYQVDIQVPTGVPQGDAVPVTIAMPGSSAGTATLSIHSR